MSEFDNSASGDHELLTATYTGEHNTDTTNLFENSETIGWEFDERALFQTVAFRIYQSDEAGVREPLLNAISSGLRAERLHDVSPKVGVYLYAGDDDRPMTLVIRDNGVGVNEDTLLNGLAHVGKSQNRWVADLVGKFGVGFLASFRLVSETGIFFMHTRARDTGDEYRGGWSSAGFEIDRGDELPDVFDENEYGTRLEFPIKDDISRAQIRNWVEHHSENARVPVEYREDGFDETPTDDNPYNFDPENKQAVYGGETLSEQYGDTVPVMTIEEDEFVAYCTPDARNNVLCLDSPVASSSTKVFSRRGNITTAPFDIDIRLLSENGPVIEGPHAGLTPVSQSELQEIPNEFHDQFVLKSELTESDIQLPHPTGTRENLSDDTDDFFPYLHERFAEMYEERMSEILSSVDTLDDVYNNISEQQRFLLLQVLNNHQYEIDRAGSVADWFDDSFGFELDDELTETLDLLATNVEVLQQGDAALSDLDRVRHNVYELVEKSADGTVFIGASLHPVKAAIAWDDHDNNRVVKLPSTSRFGAVESVSEMYDVLGETFDWAPLKDISPSTLDEYNADEDLKDDLRNGVRQTGAGVENRELTLHLDNKEYKWKITVGDLAEYMDEFHDDDTELDEDDQRLSWSYDKPSRVIIFPSTADANVSDHYDLSTKSTAVGYCTKKAAKYLDGVPGVVRFNEMADDAREVTLSTSDGQHSVDGTPNRPAIHIVPDDLYDQFSSDEVMASGAEYIPKNNKRQFRPEDWTWMENDDDELADATYIPVTPELFERVSPALPSDAVVFIDSSRHLPTRKNTDGMRSISNTSLYGYARLPEWRDSTKFDNIMQGAASFERGGKEMVDALAESHNNGFALGDDSTDE